MTTPPPPAPQQGYPQPAAQIPGKTLGIVAFILAFFFQLLALILGIVAKVQSNKVGYSNPWALWAIILSVVFMVFGIIIYSIVIANATISMT